LSYSVEYYFSVVHDDDGDDGDGWVGVVIDDEQVGLCASILL
jgi:hypothetical protein